MFIYHLSYKSAEGNGKTISCMQKDNILARAKIHTPQGRQKKFRAIRKPPSLF